MVASQEDVIVELNRVLASPGFLSSPRLAQFLRFCVETSLDSKQAILKESTIGVAVFGRSPGYDPKIDPIVRVHARRLREKLAALYESEVTCNIRIEVPKGSYVPQFERLTEPPCSVPAILPAPVAEIVTRETGPAKSTRRHKENRLAAWWSWAVVCIAALAVIAAMLTYAHRSRQSQQIAQATGWSFPERLTSLPGAERESAWSPDGNKLAFTWDEGGQRKPHVYLQESEQGTPCALSKSDLAEYSPAWSPDGNRLALVRELSSNLFRVLTVDVATREEHPIGDLHFYSAPLELGPTLDWSPDGKWLLTNDQQPGKPVHLVRLSVRENSAEQITDPPEASTGDFEARFSPEGDRIVFRRGGMGDVWGMSIEQRHLSQPKQLTKDNRGVRGLAWSADGAYIYYGRRRKDSGFGIWRLPWDGGQPDLVTPEGVDAVSPAIHPLSGALTFTRPATDVNLWTFYSDPAIPPHALTPSTQPDYSPRYSADGKQIAFISTRSGSPQVWVSSRDGSAARCVTALDSIGMPMFPSWSPDGQKIVYFYRRDGLNYAVETPLSAKPPRNILGGHEYSLFPQYSPDGEWLYYSSNIGRRFRIWRKKTGISKADRNWPPEPVTTDEAEFFRLSSDGRSLYFEKPGEITTLVRKNLMTNAQQTIWKWETGFVPRGSWDVVQDRLYFLEKSSTGSGAQLIAADIQTRTERTLANLKLSAPGWESGLAAAPDGQSVTVARLDRDDTDLMLMKKR